MAGELTSFWLARKRGVVTPASTPVGPVGPYPPPTGFRWGYVTENTVIVTENGDPVVELERIAA